MTLSDIVANLLTIADNLDVVAQEESDKIRDIANQLNSVPVMVDQQISPFTKVLIGIIKLHMLDTIGKNDSELADAFRDEMDYVWHLLSEKQIKILQSVSVELG